MSIVNYGVYSQCIYNLTVIWSKCMWYMRKTEENARFEASWASSGLWFVWQVGARSREGDARSLSRLSDGRVWDRDGECLWTLFAQPTVLASKDLCQALIYRSASLVRKESLSSTPSILSSSLICPVTGNIVAFRDCSRMQSPCESLPAIHY